MKTKLIEFFLTPSWVQKQKIIIFVVLMSHFFQTYNIYVAIVEIQDKTVSKSIWLKSGFYLSNHIEDLINHHYWSFSVIFILTNQIMTYFQRPLGFIRLINKRKNFSFETLYLNSCNHDAICKYILHTKVYLNTTSNGGYQIRK